MPTDITRVTVFRKGAQVYRTGNLNVREGKTLIRLKGLTPDLDPKSIKVTGSEGLTILSIAHTWNTTAAAINTHAMDSLLFISKNISWTIDNWKLRQDVLYEKMNLLQENKQIGSKTTGVSTEQLEKALALFETTFMESKREVLVINRKVDSLNQVQQLIMEQVKALRGTPLISKSEIEILVMSDHAQAGSLEVSYIVQNAGWIPRYDIRAKDINHPIDLVYNADIRQETGEIWKNVKLSFSNASPYGRQTAPELSTWKLTTLANTSFRRIGVEEVSFGIRKITGNVRDVSGEPLIFANVYVDGHNLGTQTDLDGNFSILMPEGANALNVAYTGYTTQTIPVTKDYLDITLSGGNSLDEVVVTGLRTARSSADISYSGSMSRVPRASREIKMPEQITVIENEISVEFELKELTTIMTDGKNISLELKSYELPAAYTYETTPKLDKGAYLIATLTNWEKYHLIEGQANLYFNNTYIGNTILDPIKLSDTLEISLGRDPEVLVDRVKEDEFTKKTFLGTNTIVEKSFKLSFRNKKKSPIHMIISDQIPVSINDAITINATQLSGGMKDENSGIIKWDLNIGSTSNEELLLSYAVKYPSKEKVILE